MTKKDYIAAARLVQAKNEQALSHAVARSMTVRVARGTSYRYLKRVADELEDSFVQFFAADNVRFDEKRFRTACKAL